MFGIAKHRMLSYTLAVLFGLGMCGVDTAWARPAATGGTPTAATATGAKKHAKKHAKRHAKKGSKKHGRAAKRHTTARAHASRTHTSHARA